MHCVLDTDEYASDVKRLGLTETERMDIALQIAIDPVCGAIIPGTGGARKLRIKKRDSGKSGGYRVVWYFPGDDVPVFMLAIFDKTEKINLTRTERNQLKKELAGIADDYRKSVARTVSGIKGATT